MNVVLEIEQSCHLEETKLRKSQPQNALCRQASSTAAQPFYFQLQVYKQTLQTKDSNCFSKALIFPISN